MCRWIGKQLSLNKAVALRFKGQIRCVSTGHISSTSGVVSHKSVGLHEQALCPHAMMIKSMFMFTYIAQFKVRYSKDAFLIILSLGCRDKVPASIVVVIRH